MVKDEPHSAQAPSEDDLAALWATLEGTARNPGSAYFESLVKHLSLATGAECAFIAEVAAVRTRVRTLALWDRGGLIDNVEWDLEGTPCADVIACGLCHFPEGVRDRFRQEREPGFESYLGMALVDGAGQVLGHLAVADRKPMSAEPRRLFALRILAARATAELERLRAEKLLGESEARFRQAQQEKARLVQQNLYLQEEIKADHNFEEIIGRSHALLSVLDAVNRVAGTDSSVLITGETGTGKELIARAIHGASRRRDRPLIKIDCAALPGDLIERALFGQEKDRSSGEVTRRLGRLELAHGGTLLLDEIGNLPAQAQARLLRVLQEREFERVGGTVTIRIDVRVLATTNRDLPACVRDRAFHEDLYHRLSDFPLRLPPLRDRKEDVALLVHFLVNKFATRIGKRIEAVGPAMLCRLGAYAWPGNVREMENVLERAVILAPGPVLEIGADVLPVHGLPAHSPPTLEDTERQHILRVLGQTGWVIDGPKGAARLLGLHPNTLRSRLKKLGIRRPGQEA